MAEALNKRLASFVECSVCLNKFDNPKQLKCNHHFCKQCLEDVIQFKEDGSGVIRCPLGCTTETVINVDETINDLNASYELKGMLGVFEENEEQLDYQIPKCLYAKNCSKDVSIYCCERIMCMPCYMNHKKTGGEKHRRKTDLSFNKRDNKFEVLCKEHFSRCTHLCSDNKLLCAYCVYRDKDHKTHSKHNIEDDIVSIKEALANYLKKKEDVLKFATHTRENMLIAETRLMQELEARKEDCLHQYSDFLDKQEEMLKSKFLGICNNHMEQYPDDLDYYEDLSRKRDVELALGKEVILDTIHRNINKPLLNMEIVSLSDTYDFASNLPLGYINVATGKDVWIRGPLLTTLRYNKKSEGIGKRKLANTGRDPVAHKRSGKSY